MSAIDYTKAYITHDDGKRLATIDNNTFVDLGAFVDGNGDALAMVYGLAFGQDGEIYLTQQKEAAMKLAAPAIPKSGELIYLQWAGTLRSPK